MIINIIIVIEIPKIRLHRKNTNNLIITVQLKMKMKWRLR